MQLNDARCLPTRVWGWDQVWIRVWGWNQVWIRVWGSNSLTGCGVPVIASTKGEPEAEPKSGTPPEMPGVGTAALLR